MWAQVNSTGNGVTLKVCGRLAEGWVPELRNCWRSARLNHPDGKILVDLKHVTFIDQEGRSLLEQMYKDGAVFSASGLMTQAIIDNITGNEA